MSKGRNKSVRRVGFFSFFKLSLLYGLAVGQLAGVLCLVSGIWGMPWHLNILEWKIEGFPAVAGCSCLLPLVLGVAAVVAAPVLYLPFTIASGILGGFKVSGEN